MNPSRTFGQIFSAVIGFAMLAVASPCVISMFNDVFIAGTDNVGGALIVGVFMAFVGVAGLILIATGLKKPEGGFHVNQALERRVLGIAREHGGRLTVSELALETELTIDQSRQVLQHLEHREAVRTHLSDHGDIVYVFGGLTVDKAAAIDPLNDAEVFDARLNDVTNVEFDLDGDDEEDVDSPAQPQEAKQDKW